jgi:hypothetical protein
MILLQMILPSLFFHEQAASIANAKGASGVSERVRDILRHPGRSRAEKAARHPDIPCEIKES